MVPVLPGLCSSVMNSSYLMGLVLLLVVCMRIIVGRQVPMVVMRSKT